MNGWYYLGNSGEIHHRFKPNLKYRPLENKIWLKLSVSYIMTYKFPINQCYVNHKTEKKKCYLVSNAHTEPLMSFFM